MRIAEHWNIVEALRQKHPHLSIDGALQAIKRKQTPKRIRREKLMDKLLRAFRKTIKRWPDEMLSQIALDLQFMDEIGVLAEKRSQAVRDRIRSRLILAKMDSKLERAA